MYEFHPYSEIWPLMQGQAFDEFVVNIRDNGLLAPILLYRGKVLDGRNRYRACLEVGIEPRFEDAGAWATNDDDALDLVVSLNTHRRHMSTDELAFAAARLADLKQGQRPNRLQLKGEPHLSDERTRLKNGGSVAVHQAAKALQVSPASVGRARAVLRYTPEQEQKVRDGAVSLSTAAATAVAKRHGSKGKPKRAGVSEMSRVPKMPPKGRVLTREMVDPEFVGDMGAFVTEYGHVWLQTAEERAATRFGAWASGSLHAAKVLRDHVLVQQKVDLNWLRSPKSRDIQKMEEAVAILEDMLGKAKAMLERARG